MGKNKELIKIQEKEIKRLNGVIKDLQTVMVNMQIKMVLIPTGTSYLETSLKNCRCYVLELPEKEDFLFEDINIEVTEKQEKLLGHTPMKFDRVMFFVPREFTDEFKFSNLPVDIMEGFQEIELPGAHAWLERIYDLPDNTPAFIVNYTERDTERFADVIINATQVKDIYIKTLERMYIYMKDQFSRFKNELNNALFLAEQERYTKEQLVNKIRDRVLLVDTKLQDQIKKVQGNEFKIKTWQAVLLGSGWVIAVILAILMGRI